MVAVLFSPRANLYWKETTPSKVEQALSNHMEDAQYGEHELFPRHQKFVELGIDFGTVGSGRATVLGSDLTNEYISVNADYRS